MWTIGKFLRGRLRILVFLSIVASTASGLLRASLIKLLNDALTRRHFDLSLYVILCVAGPLSGILAELIGGLAINDLMHKVLLTLARQIIKLPLSRLEDLGSHKVFSALTEDTYLITSALKLFPNLVVQSSMVIGCAIFLAHLSWKAFLCLLVIVIVAAFTFRRTHTMGQRYLRQARRCTDNIVRHIQYLAGNIKELQLHFHTRDRFLTEGLSQAANSYRRPALLGSALYSFNANANHVIFFITMGIMLSMGPRWLSGSPHGVETGYGLVLLFLIGPVTSLTLLMSNVGAISAALRHIEELGLALDADLPMERPPDVGLTVGSGIDLAGLVYAYGTAEMSERFAVGPISLELKAGSVIFIVGGNGSGKTTAAKLCCGLYRPEAGTIVWNGTRVGDHNLAEYRELFGVVFSDLYLFERAFNLPLDASPIEFDRLLRLFGLHDKIAFNSGTLSTVVLSRGQQKRLALALALMEDRAVYVLDEWAADQDPHFRKVFYRQILPSMRRSGKCVLVVSHDDGFFDVADQVVRMERGSMVEDNKTAQTEAQPALQYPETS